MDIHKKMSLKIMCHKTLANGDGVGLMRGRKVDTFCHVALTVPHVKMNFCNRAQDLMLISCTNCKN